MSERRCWIEDVRRSVEGSKKFDVGRTKWGNVREKMLDRRFAGGSREGNRERRYLRIDVRTVKHIAARGWSAGGWIR